MASAPYQSELSPRAHQLLKSLVAQYIRDGHPVGSRTLSRDSGLDVSAATIRNVMADLEEMGLIAAPHTSAGRIPTVQGYRLFVDTMLTMRPPAAAAVQPPPPPRYGRGIWSARTGALKASRGGNCTCVCPAPPDAGTPPANAPCAYPGTCPACAGGCPPPAQMFCPCWCWWCWWCCC